MIDPTGLGLLLDLDGPVASPVHRRIVHDSIADDIVALVDAGAVVVFNTGRSDAFVAEVIVPALAARGIRPERRVIGVCEKGGVWFHVTADGIGELTTDEAFRPPAAVVEGVDALVTERYAGTMFFDRTKRTMISVEQRTDVESADYLAVQPAFDRDVLELFRQHGTGAELDGDRAPDAEGEVAFRIDPTIISTDIESVRVGKDLGAERAVRMLEADGLPVPRRWFSMGDSPSDYRMADWMHETGRGVTHVDVRPVAVGEKPYEVLRPEDGLVNDDAGAVFLRRIREEALGPLTR